MAYDNAQMAAALGELLGLTPEQIAELQADLDQWALGGARLATWARLATDISLFNNAAVAMVHDWYAGTADGGPEGDGLYPLMNSEGVVFFVPAPARVAADLTGFEPKGTLPSVGDLPPVGEPGDLWVIEGNAWGWNSRDAAWKNMGLFQGAAGPEVELQKSATHVQWRVVGASTWINLVALADLKGADGEEVELQVNATHIQWRLGTGEWTDLIARAALMGSDGREIELQKSATHIQWRYVGDAGWTDLIPLADLKVTGDAGSNGWTQVEAIAEDGERRVKRIIDWVGGTGTKPDTGKYVGPAGLVDTAAEATNVRGPGGAGSGDMQAANNLSDLTDDAAARTNLDVYSKAQVDTAIAGCATDGELSLLQGDVDDLAAAVGAISVPVKATGAELRAGTNDAKFATAKSLADEAAWVEVTTSGAWAPDFAAGRNFSVILSGALTFNAPTNMADGQSGAIRFQQDATGSRTIGVNAAIKKVGAYTLSTAANAVDRCGYIVKGTVLELTALEKGVG